MGLVNMHIIVSPCGQVHFGQGRWVSAFQAGHVGKCILGRVYGQVYFRQGIWVSTYVNEGRCEKCLFVVVLLHSNSISAISWR